MKTKLVLLMLFIAMTLVGRSAFASGTITVDATYWRMTGAFDWGSGGSLTGGDNTIHYATALDAANYGCTFTATNYTNTNGAAFFNWQVLNATANCKKSGVYVRWTTVKSYASTCPANSTGTPPTCTCTDPYSPNASGTACAIIATDTACTAGELDSSGTFYNTGSGDFPTHICVGGCVWTTGDGIATVDNFWTVNKKKNTGASCSSTGATGAAAADGAPITNVQTSTATTTTTGTDGTGTVATSSVTETTTIGGGGGAVTVNIDTTGLNQQVTQAQVEANTAATAANTQAIANALDLSGQSTVIAGASTAVADMNASTDSVVANFTDATSMPEASWSWFTWQPDFGAGTCTPFSKTIYGHLIVLDLCAWVINIRDALGWLFAMFAAWDIFSLTFRRVA